MSPVSPAAGIAERIALDVSELTEEYLGVTPERTRTYIHDDVVLVVVEGTLSGSEVRLARMGGPREVRAMRRRDDDTYAVPLVESVEMRTGIGVRAAMTDTNVEAGSSAHIFLLDSPLGPQAATGQA
jgi:uncharacterized protein YbcI